MIAARSHGQDGRATSIKAIHYHVVVRDPDGRMLETFRSFGRYDGQITWGHQLAVAKNGDVYVCDIKGMRAQKFARLW